MRTRTLLSILFPFISQLPLSPLISPFYDYLDVYRVTVMFSVCNDLYGIYSHEGVMLSHMLNSIMSIMKVIYYLWTIKTLKCKINYEKKKNLPGEFGALDGIMKQHD